MLFSKSSHLFRIRLIVEPEDFRHFLIGQLQRFADAAHLLQREVALPVELAAQRNRVDPDLLCDSPARFFHEDDMIEKHLFVDHLCLLSFGYVMSINPSLRFCQQEMHFCKHYFIFRKQKARVLPGLGSMIGGALFLVLSLFGFYESCSVSL